MYTLFEVANDEYKLRLGVRDIVNLEKKLGMNPMGIFGTGDTIPEVTQMVTVLWASMQKYHHGMTMDKCYDVFEAYLEDNTMTDFISVIIDVYRVSGIIPKEDEPKN